jgi:hypothetical protein
MGLFGAIGKGIGSAARSVGKRMSENRASSPFWQTWKDRFKKEPSTKEGYGVRKFIAKGSDMSADEAAAMPAGYKKGGIVKKTGMAKVHKGEKVLTKQQQQKRMRK